MTAAKSRRAAIDEALAECPVDRWVHFDDLSDFMQAADLEFDVTRDPWRSSTRTAHGWTTPICRERMIWSF